MKCILKGALSDQPSKRNQSKRTFERQISDIVNDADKNKDNEISQEEFLVLMKDVVSIVLFAAYLCRPMSSQLGTFGKNTVLL